MTEQASGIGPEQQRLYDRLFGDPSRKIRNFNFTVGDGAPTPEQLCGEINKALDEVERRKALGLPDDGPPKSMREPQHIDDFLAEMEARVAAQRLVDHQRDGEASAAVSSEAADGPHPVEREMGR
jgi:hypothetical protein